jgi:type VI protein secretion system component VasK
MMSFWREIFRRLIGSEVDTSIAIVKIQSAIVYLNVVKDFRRMSMLLCLLVFAVVVLACGFLLVPISLCLFMPWTPETKAIVAAGFGVAYVVISLIVVAVLFREKSWMKASKADKLLKEVFKQ